MHCQGYITKRFKSENGVPDRVNSDIFAHLLREITTYHLKQVIRTLAFHLEFMIIYSLYLTLL